MQKKNSYKIAILSDSHKKLKRLKKALDVLVGDGCEFVIHGGDLVELEALKLLESLPCRYVAVYGNNDAHLLKYQNDFNLVKEPHYFKLANTTFKLMHLPFFMSGDTEVVIFGHTHEFYEDFQNGTLFLNPGEVCGRKKEAIECAMLEVFEDRFLLDYYQISKDEVKKQRYEYKR